jgi:hypothetical protein
MIVLELPLPICDHPSFDRPLPTERLWRYTDLSKFVELLTSGTLWLANAEILASDDPFEGLPGAIQFPHRIWNSIADVPEHLRVQILQIFGQGTAVTPETAFRSWRMIAEQMCIMKKFGRRNFYVNCWHAGEHESAAMWKIYGSPGAGVAIVTNGARIETALAANEEQLYLGTVNYREPSWVEIGIRNALDAIMIKRSSYSYEQEVRIVHWKTDHVHNGIDYDAWNDETMLFERFIDDVRPIQPGMSVNCDIDTIIEMVIVSPYAPSWYLPMVERLRDRFGHSFLVRKSNLLDPPPVV